MPLHQTFQQLLDIQMPGMQSKLTDYERQLLARSEGRRENLIAKIYNDYMLCKAGCEELLIKATGKHEFWTVEFEQAADYLLKQKI